MTFPPPLRRDRPSAVRDFPSSPPRNPTAVLSHIIFNHEATAFHNYPPNSAAQRPTASRTFPPLCGIPLMLHQETTRRRVHGTIPSLWLEFLSFQQADDGEAVVDGADDGDLMSTPSERDDDEADDEALIEIDDADVEDLMSATESDDAGDEDLMFVDDLLFSTEMDEYLIADDGLPEEVVARFMKTMSCEEVVAAGDGEICSVCQDDLCREDRTDVGVLRCRHRFHADCIGKWLQMKNVCPLCKAVALEFL